MSQTVNAPAARVVIRTVLITTDFSELANRALPSAAALLPNGGRIHLLNVQHPRCLPSGWLWTSAIRPRPLRWWRRAPI